MSIVRRLVVLSLAVLFVLSAAAAGAAPPTGNRDREVRVMSRNLYLGASLGPLIAPPGGDVLAGVREFWAQVQATDYPQRAQALADEIVDDAPLLVRLQEVTTYRSGPVFSLEPAEEVIVDFLQILLAELAARGAHSASSRRSRTSTVSGSSTPTRRPSAMP